MSRAHSFTASLLFLFLFLDLVYSPSFLSLFLLHPALVPLFDEYLIPNASWGHEDFMVNRKLGTVVHPHILEVLNKAKKVADDDLDIAATRL